MFHKIHALFVGLGLFLVLDVVFAQEIAKRQLVYVSQGRIKDLLNCEWNTLCEVTLPLQTNVASTLSKLSEEDSRFKRWEDDFLNSVEFFTVYWRHNRSLVATGERRAKDGVIVWQVEYGDDHRLQLYRKNDDHPYLLKVTQPQGYDPRGEKEGRLIRAFSISKGQKLEQELVPMYAEPELEPGAYLDERDHWRRRRSTSYEDIIQYRSEYWSDDELREKLKMQITWDSDPPTIHQELVRINYKRIDDPRAFFVSNDAGWYTPNLRDEVASGRRADASWSPQRDSNAGYIAYMRRHDNERLVILRLVGDQLYAICQYYSLPKATALRVIQSPERKVPKAANLPDIFGPVARGDTPRSPEAWEGSRRLVDPGEFLRKHAPGFELLRTEVQHKPDASDQSWRTNTDVKRFLFASLDPKNQQLASPAFHIFSYSNGEKLTEIHSYDELWRETIYRPPARKERVASDPAGSDSPEEPGDEIVERPASVALSAERACLIDETEHLRPHWRVIIEAGYYQMVIPAVKIQRIAGLLLLVPASLMVLAFLKNAKRKRRISEAIREARKFTRLDLPQVDQYGQA